MATVAIDSPAMTGIDLESRRASTTGDIVRLHRIAEVRRQQGLSLRTVARRTGVEVRELRQQEQPNADLPLSALYLWQQALDVPIQNLLQDYDAELSTTTQNRAALVKVMKTVVALSEISSSPRVARLVTMLKEQLVEMMPELADIGGWPNYGSRRPPDQQGRIAENPIDIHSLSLD